MGPRSPESTTPGQTHTGMSPFSQRNPEESKTHSSVTSSISHSSQDHQQQKSSPLTEDEEKFHEMVSAQVKQAVKVIERKLDSVRKEREAAIFRIENEVKNAF